MRFNHLLLTLGMILLISFTSHATSPNKTPPVSLAIKPLACVVKTAGENCQMTITAHWQSTQAIDACLYQEQQTLACWQQQKQASKTLDISLTNDMTFTLKNQLGDVIASQRIQINVSQPTKYRRRLRAQWSIF